jgi:hypothetical protein
MVRSFDNIGVPYPLLEIYHDLYFYPTIINIPDNKIIHLELALYSDRNHTKKLKV